MMRQFLGSWPVGWEIIGHDAQNRLKLRFWVLGANWGGQSSPVDEHHLRDFFFRCLKMRMYPKDDIRGWVELGTVS